MLNVVERGRSPEVDEFTRKCLFITRGTPGHIRSDNRPEFVAMTVKGWITGVRAKTAFIEPGSPWENGHGESFNGKLRDALLGCEMFNSLETVTAGLASETARIAWGR